MIVRAYACYCDYSCAYDSAYYCVLIGIMRVLLLVRSSGHMILHRNAHRTVPIIVNIIVLMVALLIGLIIVHSLARIIVRTIVHMRAFIIVLKSLLYYRAYY